ncbi:unnamed protein product, partial [Phaeothamnion confervicola]
QSRTSTAAAPSGLWGLGRHKPRGMSPSCCQVCLQTDIPIRHPFLPFSFSHVPFSDDVRSSTAHSANKYSIGICIRSSRLQAERKSRRGMGRRSAHGQLYNSGA